MIAELFTNNALNLVIIFGSCAALILMSFWFRRGNRKRKGFLFHAVQFLIYTIIISAVGSIINYVIENYKLKFITPGVIDFICTSLIAVILTIKLFLLINQFEKQQIKKGRDITSARIMSRIIKITIIVVLVLLYGEHFGMSLSGLLTFGGIGGLDYALFRPSFQYWRLDPFTGQKYRRYSSGNWLANYQNYDL